MILFFYCASYTHPKNGNQYSKQSESHIGIMHNVAFALWPDIRR